MTDSTLTSDPLHPTAAEELVHGRHGSPFDVLGPHQVADESGSLTIIRTFRPGARSVWILPTESDAFTGAADVPARIPMRRIHPEGLFSATIPGWTGTQRYQLEAEYGDGSFRRTRDPYAFGPTLTDFDLYLFGEGTHYETYERLGAHPRVQDGIQGIGFAVWAPNAQRVSVVGEFNGWDDRLHVMRQRSNGVWEMFIPDLPTGTLYKYAIRSWNKGYQALKADPYAFAAELRPGTASRVWDLSGYAWSDDDWMRARAQRNLLGQPLTIYEVHAGSWRADPDTDGHGSVTYRGLAHQLVPYLQELGYTHVELMPIAEHPFDGSWGYQVTGYFAPTSRYGTPQDFMYFVDHCHQHGVGVIVDWVPAHFPKDEHGLNYFDGTHLYEHEDPRLGEHPDWGTLVFNYGRNEVANFLLANALFWLDKYHIDGLRVDAVASMLYLDYSRKEGAWKPNKFGGRENLEAITFLRRFNELVHGRFPGTMTIAEESTAWPQVSRPTYVGGLGFTFKWNMGWMHDVLDYMSHDPIHRRYHHNELTFSMMYAFSENFILPFSHDEVVHLKGSMLAKMPGDTWQKFANLRLLYAFMYGHPGKKLLFMGSEFGQWAEWNYASWLSWFLLGPTGDHESLHAQIRRLVADLNHLLLKSPPLFEADFDPVGFEWIDANDADNSIVSFIRYSRERHESLIFVCNFTPVPRQQYRIGVPHAGFYVEIMNTDSALYGGSNMGNLGGVNSEPMPMHGRPHSVSLTLPPLAAVVLRAEVEPTREQPIHEEQASTLASGTTHESNPRASSDGAAHDVGSTSRVQAAPRHVASDTPHEKRRRAASTKGGNGVERRQRVARAHARVNSGQSTDAEATHS